MVPRRAPVQLPGLCRLLLARLLVEAAAAALEADEGLAVGCQGIVWRRQRLLRLRCLVLVEPLDEARELGWVGSDAVLDDFDGDAYA